MKFGGIIDKYTIDQAVEDGAVVPLLYEGRHVVQDLKERVIDDWFEMISRELNTEQKADLKKKFARADQLNEADQKIWRYRLGCLPPLGKRVERDQGSKLN